MTSTAAAEPELSPEAFDILRAAVNVARYQGVRKVAALRQKLLAMFPEKEEQIQQALAYWANYEVSKGGHDR